MTYEDVKETYHDQDNDFVIKRVQEISDDFLRENRRIRDEQAKRPCRNLHKVASIPVIFVLEWMKEGFNIYEESQAAIIKRCKERGLDDFITTNRKF